jgi:hypothetical protein
VGAACDVGVSDVAGDAAAAGEVFPEAETITWRMFSAAACSLSTRSPQDTTTGIRQPAEGLAAGLTLQPDWREWKGLV